MDRRGRPRNHGLPTARTKIIGHGPTLTVAKLEDSETVVGGFTSVPWSDGTIAADVEDFNAFISKFDGPNDDEGELIDEVTRAVHTKIGPGDDGEDDWAFYRPFLGFLKIP